MGVKEVLMSVLLLPIQMLVVAVLAAIVGFHVSGKYHETKAQYKELLMTQQHERNILSAMVLTSLFTMGIQKTYRAFRRWLERHDDNFCKYKVYYGGAKDTMQNRARAALGRANESLGRRRKHWGTMKQNKMCVQCVSIYICWSIDRTDTIIYEFKNGISFDKIWPTFHLSPWQQ